MTVMMAPSHAVSNVGRVELYQRSMHATVRIAIGLMLLMYLIGLAALAVDFPIPFTWRDLGGLIVVVAFPWLVTLPLRTREVYGSARGLEYRDRRTWIRVPWSQVQPAQYAWWSSSPITSVGRMATLRVPGRASSIYFYANDRNLTDLRSLRDVGLLAERSQSREVPPSS